MKIVTMTAEHLGEVKALLDVCFGESAWSMDSLRSQMEKADSHCTVAIEQDSVIGFLAFEQVLDEGSIIEVAVAPDCRRKGIAKALITQAIQSADGPAAVFLEVRESNAPAVSLYEALGFEQIGERKDYYDRPKENAIIMRKKDENTCNRKQL